MTAKTKTSESTENKIAAEQPLISENILIERMPVETITIFAGQEHYAPIPYHSFDVGPISIATTVRESEAYEDTIERCRVLLNGQMQEQFTEKMIGFFDRLGQLDEHMVGLGMATRKQQETFAPNSSRPQASRTDPPYTPKEPASTSNMLGFTGNPEANGTDQLPTVGQNNFFGKLQKDKNVDGRAICLEIFGVEPHNLHRAAMSKLIDYLKDEVPYGGNSLKVPEEFSGPPPQDAGPGSSGTRTEYDPVSNADIPF